jgi:cytoskeletal protein RodZ
MPGSSRSGHGFFEPSKMKHRFSWLLGASFLLLVAIILLLRNTAKETPENDGKSQSPLTAAVPTGSTKSLLPASRSETEKHAAKPSAPPANQAVILAQIEDASVTYDAKALPLIEPYLLSPDPVVREAAMKGMINLGDAAAGPLLREASHHVSTPQEAVALLEAADYVELPSGRPILNKRSANTPHGTEAPAMKKRKPGHQGTKNPDPPVVPATE